MCDSDSNSEDESEKDDESLQEAYENTQWLKVCATNRALNGEIQELRDLKAIAKGKVVQLETLLAEKDENLNSIAIELESTKKTLCLLHNRTSNLDHLITSGKSFGDHSGIGFKGDSSSVKTMFIKFRLLIESVGTLNHKSVIKSVATEGKSTV